MVHSFIPDPTCRPPITMLSLFNPFGFFLQLFLLSFLRPFGVVPAGPDGPPVTAPADPSPARAPSAGAEQVAGSAELNTNTLTLVGSVEIGSDDAKIIDFVNLPGWKRLISTRVGAIFVSDLSVSVTPAGTLSAGPHAYFGAAAIVGFKTGTPSVSKILNLEGAVPLNVTIAGSTPSLVAFPSGIRRSTYPQDYGAPPYLAIAGNGVAFSKAIVTVSARVALGGVGAATDF